MRINVWRNKFVELTNLGLADGRLTMFSTQASQLTNGLGNVALIALGTYLVLGSRITLGTMMMFFLFRAFLVERLNRAVVLRDGAAPRAHQRRADRGRDGRRAGGADAAAASGRSSSPTAPASASRSRTSGSATATTARGS